MHFILFFCLVPKTVSVQKPWRNVLWTAEYVFDLTDYVSLCTYGFNASGMFSFTEKEQSLWNRSGLTNP